MKILLVEDCKQIAEVIFDFFDDSTKYQLDYAATGPQGLALALDNSYDCIILDIMLPGMDGINVCQQLRAHENLTPIIMLTARDTKQDILTGLNIGADDYIVKPFDLALLEARIHTVLRRTNRSEFQQSIELGKLKLDLTTHTLEREGQCIKLNPSCFKILKLLMQRHPNIATREEIANLLWPDDPPDHDVLRKHIYLLRNKIDKGFAHELLITIPKIGYKIDI